MNARKKTKQLVYNFKDRFAPAVEMGLKTSTIRLFEKTAPPVKGDPKFFVPWNSLHNSEPKVTHPKGGDIAEWPADLRVREFYK